ncbi:hypothetical protein BCR39DRAFT_517957 [Naematelia encephala]|uniref:Uncharacterized protein n=1 Tax=Naematelia encephala TaxID=71784 RepID=A0A1Y2BGM8_9TREE|nr:hypothetical protein BCR39DRAFT_517957 [Naematelia encephala]
MFGKAPGRSPGESKATTEKKKNSLNPNFQRLPGRDVALAFNLVFLFLLVFRALTVDLFLSRPRS